MANPGYQPVPTGSAAGKGDQVPSLQWVRRIADAVNGILKGKVNAVLPVTLTANAASTTVLDARISYFSALILEPLTAHAAAALYASPYVLPTAQASGTVTFDHANDALTDKNFNLLIIG
jgi:hypothetical protein